MTEIGKAYGGALFQLAREEGLDETIGAQLKVLCDALREDPDYVRLMMTPTLKKSKRLEILSESFSGKIHEYVLNFLSILVENGTFEEIFACREEYQKLYNKAHGIVTVVAYTVIELDDELQGKLCEKLEKTLGKTVELQCRIDRSMLGGVRLEMEGERLDGSVKSRLDGIRAALFGAKA